MTTQFKLATFAGGCFWCMVSPFDEQQGIHRVVSGFTGGHAGNPTSDEVHTHKKGHYEAVQITIQLFSHIKNCSICIGNKLIQLMRVGNLTTAVKLIER